MNAGEPLLDSLPYYDIDIENAHLKALVNAEIARELKRIPKPASDPRVPGEFELFKVCKSYPRPCNLYFALSISQYCKRRTRPIQKLGLHLHRFSIFEP